MRTINRQENLGSSLAGVCLSLKLIEDFISFRFTLSTVESIAIIVQSMVGMVGMELEQ